MTDKELLEKWKRAYIEDKTSDDFNPLPPLNDEGIRCANNSTDKAFAQYGLCNRDVSSLDFSHISLEQMKYITFNSSTIWPNPLPIGFNPNEILQKAIEKPRNLQKIHQMNFRGQGTKCVVIDQPLAFSLRHTEIADIHIQRKTFGSLTDYGYNFHGEAVLSFLSGKNLGVAPDCEVEYYFSTPIFYDNMTRQEYNIQTFWHQVDILKEVLNRVKNGEKIDAINLSSRPLNYVDEYFSSEKEKTYKMYYDLCKELQSYGCEVIDGDRYSKDFLPCETDFTNDINDYDSYRNPISCSFYWCKPSDDKIRFLCGGRAIPEFFSEHGYKYEQFSCDSWTIPQVTGYFLIARQIMPTISFNKFLEIAKKSSFKNKNGLLIFDCLKYIDNLKEKTTINQQEL